MPWNVLSPREQVGLAMIGLGFLLFAVEWGKYRLSLLSKRRLTWLGCGLTVVGLLVIGKNQAILHSWWVVVGLPGLFAVGFVSARVAGNRLPTLRFQRAVLEMREWTRYNYGHLRKLPEKGVRPNDRRARGTLADLQAAADFFKKDQSRDAQVNLAIAQLEAGLMLRMMNSWEDAAAKFDASIACLERLDRQPPSDIVLRELHMTWPGKGGAASESLPILAAIDQSFATRVGSEPYPGPNEVMELKGEARYRKAVVSTLATALFRRGELYQIVGDPKVATQMYRRSLAIHEQLRDAPSVALIRKLMNAIG